jgi:hypothetical protein
MGIVKYKHIPNFLTKDELQVLGYYVEFKHRLNYTDFDNRQSTIMDTSYYSDPLMESYLLAKKDKIEKEVGEKLHATYSFWRMYTKGADLKKHKDRPSCEISVSINLRDSGEDWALYFDGTPVVTKVGDAVIYKGMDVEHWREPFKGDHQAQVFLHYVRVDGKYAHFSGDGRPMYGYPK